MRLQVSALVLFFSLAVAAGATSPPVLFQTPLSPRNANYAISALLDTKTHIVEATEKVAWRNLTADTVSEAKFHLYLNAFSDDKTVFMRESGGSHRAFDFDLKSFGYCQVTSISQEDPAGGPRAGLAQAFPGEDRTVMRVALPFPVPPGGEAVFRIAFRSQLPKVFARSGYSGDFHMVGQWFPKLGVYEEGRGWNCHPYHLNSEFFADFGVYDVDITAPGRFVVGATGVEWAKEARGKNVTRRFHAEDVHDFAFAASPDFVEVKDRWEGCGKRVDLRFLMLPGNLPQAARYARALKAALGWSAGHLAPFPYGVFTVVDPAAGGAAGMEYPTLVTAGTVPGMPTSVTFPEMVVVHEFLHNYFYGMAASNEFEEAWLDEGMTSYCEMRVMDDMFGRDSSTLDGLLGWHMGTEASQRTSYTGAPDLDPMVRCAWEYKGSGSYSAISYAKSTLVLRTLETRMGRPAFDAALKRYFLAVRFTHPTTADFERIFCAGASPSLASLLHELLYTTDTADFRVISVRRWESSTGGGFAERGGKMVRVGEVEGKAKKPSRKAGSPPRKELCEVTVGRRGELVLPVEVMVVFEDGTRRTEFWDGTGNWKKFRFHGSPVAEVVVDPAGKVPLDLNRLNNGWRSEPGSLPARSLLNRARILAQGLLLVWLNVL